MIEAYETNRPMREAHCRMNGFTHVEIYETDDEEGTLYPFLTSGDGIGIVERSAACYTEGQVMAWAKRYAPELDHSLI